MNAKSVYFNAEFVQGRKGQLSHYTPLHEGVRNCAFQFDSTDAKQDEIASTEAHLADAISRVAELNGLGFSEAMRIFPLVLRMLKSNSNWAK